MSFRAAISALALTAVLVGPVSAAEPAASTLTLAQAQQIALQNHPTVRLSNFDVSAAQALVDVAKSSYYPQVGASAVRAFAGDGTRIGTTGTGITDPTILQRESVGVNVSQLITDFGKTDSLVDASKDALQAQIAVGQETREAVLLSVTQAYFDLLRTQALLKVADSTFKQRDTLLGQIKSLQSAQLRSNLDVSIAQQDLDDAQQMVLQAKDSVADATATLVEALGYNDTRHFNLADIATVPAMTQRLDGALEEASNQNPELTELRAQRNAAKAYAEAASRAFYPTVSAMAYGGGNPIREEDQKLNPAYGTLGVVLSIPLFTGGSLEGQERADQERAEAAQAAFDAQRNRLLRDVHIAFDSLNTAYANIEVTQHQVDNAADSLRLTEARYQIGSSSIVDLSTAQLRQTQAQIAHTDAIYQYLIRRAALDYVTGSIADNGTP
ncbi:MAG TPA: TolC family protein [Magnetospirillaceae bacterium]|jgi:outer membrane protein